MLKEKLINVKLILRIMISVLIIFSMFKSCANATTFNMTECNNKWTTESIATELIKYFSPNYTNDAKALQWIDNIKDYDYTCFGVDWGTYTHRMYCWKLQESGYFNGSANSDNFRTYYNANNLSWIIDFSTSSNKPTNVFSATNTNFKNQGMNFDSVYMVCNANNKFYEGGSSAFKLSNLTPPSSFEFTPYRIAEIDDYYILKYSYTGNIALGSLGENDFYQLQVRLKDANLNTIGTMYYDENQNCYYADNALINIDNRIEVKTVYLYYYQPYFLEFTIYQDSSNYDMAGYLYKFYPINATIENGAITYSGDATFNGQDQTIQNQTFIQNLYNKAFTVSGDYISGKIEELKNNNLFPSGDVELETKFLNLIENNNGDFKIAWNSFTPHFSVGGTQIQNKEFIASGEVNFSKLERENEELQTTMNWTRTILGFSLGALLLKNLWKTLMLMLGVGIQVYDTNEDEKKIAKKGDK